MNEGIFLSYHSFFKQHYFHTLMHHIQERSLFDHQIMNFLSHDCPRHKSSKIEVMQRFLVHRVVINISDRWSLCALKLSLSCIFSFRTKTFTRVYLYSSSFYSSLFVFLPAVILTLLACPFYYETYY